MPSSGERCPKRTKKRPRKPVACSSAATSAGDSTTHNCVRSRCALAHSEHTSCSVKLRHIRQCPTRSAAAAKARARRRAPARGRGGGGGGGRGAGGGPAPGGRRGAGGS